MLSEDYLLGCIIDNENNYDSCIDIITVDDFSTTDKKNIFNAITHLYNNNSTATPLTISNHLKLKKTQRESQFRYLEQLNSKKYNATIRETIDIAHIVKNESDRRNISDLAYRLNDLAEDSKADILTDSLNEIDRVISSRAKSKVLAISDQVSIIEAEISERIKQPNNILTGIATGFGAIDDMTDGFQRGDLIILAARPSMGKTALCLNLIKNMSKAGNALFFSLEMSYKQLIYRMTADISGVEFHKVFRGNLNEDETLRVDEATKRIKQLKLFIDDRGGVSVDEIRSRARVFNRKNPLNIIGVDYLSLVSGKGENRTNEIGYVSRQLKLLAKECDCPVLCLSQLSRGVEQRQDKRPLLTDLRESGAIEQDADIVAFIYREQMYNPDTENPDLAELLIRKNRNGECKTLYFEFKKDVQQFRSVNKPVLDGWN